VTKLNDGNVVWVNLNPAKGNEQRKIWPCLVIESQASPLSLVIVMPIRDANGKTGKKLFVDIRDLKRAGLEKPSVIDVYQIRAIDPKRITSVMGEVDLTVLNDAKRRFGLLLDLDV